MDPNNTQQNDQQNPNPPTSTPPVPPTQGPEPTPTVNPEPTPVSNPEPVPTPNPEPTPALDQATPTESMQKLESSAPVTQASSPTQMPKSGGKKGLILAVILILLILGIAVYIFFVKNMINSAQKSASNIKTVAPTVAPPTVTPATVEEINIASPDADLNSIEKDVQGL